MGPPRKTYACNHSRTALYVWQKLLNAGLCHRRCGTVRGVYPWAARFGREGKAGYSLETAIRHIYLLGLPLSRIPHSWTITFAPYLQQNRKHRWLISTAVKAMDHLPQLKNRSGFRVEVRFLEDARFAYDGKGLEGFPGRCNFTFAKPHDLQTCWESSKFFQSWLFFGTLVEIFKVYNILILSDDFVSRAGNGHATITTKCLRDYIAA